MCITAAFPEHVQAKVEADFRILHTTCQNDIKALNKKFPSEGYSRWGLRFRFTLDARFQKDFQDLPTSIETGNNQPTYGRADVGGAPQYGVVGTGLTVFSCVCVIVCAKGPHIWRLV